jgi:hypothetical protein
MTDNREAYKSSPAWSCPASIQWRVRASQN